MAEQTYKSIQKLRIYQASRALEDKVHELVKALPSSEFYGLGDGLRRSSAAISHYIFEGNKRYSYTLKLEAMHLARAEAERLRQKLSDYAEEGYGNTATLQQACSVLIKQSWGLIRYLKKQQEQRQTAARVNAADQLVLARR